MEETRAQETAPSLLRLSGEGGREGRHGCEYTSTGRAREVNREGVYKIERRGTGPDRERPSEIIGLARQPSPAALVMRDEHTHN
jgi:hypothetical protein